MDINIWGVDSKYVKQITFAVEWTEVRLVVSRKCELCGRSVRGRAVAGREIMVETQWEGREYGPGMGRGRPFYAHRECRALEILGGKH